MKHIETIKIFFVDCFYDIIEPQHLLILLFPIVIGIGYCIAEYFDKKI